MGERGRELCVLGRIPNNSLMVVCGDEVMVAAVHNVVAMDDVAAIVDVVAAVGVVVVVGAATAIITQKGFTTSSTPLHGSFVHFPTIFPSKTHKTMQNASKRP